MLRAFLDGRQLPPPGRHLYGLLLKEVDPGEARFEMPASPWLAPPVGVIQGATLALLVDGPLGCAFQTTLPPATPYTTSEMSMSFIHPVLPDGGTLTSTARVVHTGRTIGLTDATVKDEAGNLMATASTRLVVLPKVDFPADFVAQALRNPPHPQVPVWSTPDPIDRPVLGAIQPQELFDRLSGLEVMRGCMTGELEAPPISHLFGLRPTEVEEGTTTWTVPSTEWLCSPVEGRLYGGFLAYFAGNAADGAIMTTCKAGTAIAPVDLKVYFLRPVAPHGEKLTALGRVIHRGRSVAIATAEVHDRDGKLVATAISSSMILPGRPATIVSPPAPDGPQPELGPDA
ncbi:MAG: PaaI family thioesterase [Candidatus Dormibacteraeota bacterium]|nr:PaaI family thioesterase [Candidatus Dormibacteraeota bacterium]